MIYFVLAIFLNIPTYVLSDLQMHTAFSLVDDVQYLLLAIGAFSVCPTRRWRTKTVVCIHLIITLSFIFFNIFVYAGLLEAGIINYISFGFLVIFLIRLSIKLMTKWDDLPRDKIELGYIYEVVGKPRNHLQWVAFLLSAGRGGTQYVTDGIDCWYFSKRTGAQEKEKYDKESLIGRKVVKVCESSGYVLAKLNSGNGLKWSILNNCLTAFRI